MPAYSTILLSARYSLYHRISSLPPCFPGSEEFQSGKERSPGPPRQIHRSVRILDLLGHLAAALQSPSHLRNSLA